MKKEDIVETIAETIKEKILEEWKHEGKIDHVLEDAIFCIIDGKYYTVELICHKDEEKTG